MDHDFSRREFILAGTLPIVSISDGGELQVESQQPKEEYEFDGVAYLLGPASARPAAGGDFFDNKIAYAYIYENHDGARFMITDGDSAWSELPVQLPAYTQGNLPTSPAQATIVYDETRGSIAWSESGHWHWPSFVDDVKTTATTVSNTTTRTQVWNPGIDVHALTEGRVYQIELQGTFSTASNADQFTVDIDIGGTDAGTLQNAPAVVTDAPWTYVMTFIVRSDGVNGSVKPDARAIFNEQPRTSDDSEITIDTTTATQLTVYISWSAADADNSVTLEQAHMKQMA